ncbi:hypothetical protein [Hyphococcus lacteus]|uniref:Uncharacterized protein n=1 Tax=Hyphococcus lacteus TaxID=3143536 RepID=A0ABV3Z3I8_9PROT
MRFLFATVLAFISAPALAHAEPVPHMHQDVAIWGIMIFAVIGLAIAIHAIGRRNK